MRLPLLLFVLVLFFITPMTHAQVKVVVMGSSTSLGAAATSGDSAWVGRMQAYYRRNAADGLDTVFTAVGCYGCVTYFQMPNSYTPPPGRPAPQPAHNVDAALALHPNIMIINLPTNDVVAGYTKKEFMDNLRYLRGYILAPGTGVSKCYITTTQPRNEPLQATRDSLRTLVDSINASFGLAAINFWDDLVTSDGTYRLKDDVRHIGFPDADYHLNDLGHRYIFQRARDINIFSPLTPLPLQLTGFTAVAENATVKLSWATEFEEPNSFFIVQRSSDGNHFENLHQLPATGTSITHAYSWTDQHPLPGNSFYRLQIKEDNTSRYSAVVRVSSKAQAVSIERLYKDNSSTNLVAELLIGKNQTATVRIINVNGAVAYQQQVQLTGSSRTITVPVGNLATGQYFFSIHTADNQSVVRGFIR